MVSTFPQVGQPKVLSWATQQPKVLSWATHGNGLGNLRTWDKCQRIQYSNPRPKQRNVKARHFRRQAYPRPLWEWKYPCRLRKTVETCRMVKRDEPNHHTISHTPPFLDRFCRKVGFYACPPRPLLHVAAFEGGVKGIVMVVVMHAQCRHEAV